MGLQDPKILRIRVVTGPHDGVAQSRKYMNYVVTEPHDGVGGPNKYEFML